MISIFDEISKIGIVPVIALDNAKDASPLAQSLLDGGLPCAEITFRTNAAEESIRSITSDFPNMLVGAGTVLTTGQVDRAVNAGAKFIVSPGLNPKIVSYCIDKKIPVIPGCANPSNIEQAIELGLEYVKFFPAEDAGGVKMIKAMSAPYKGIKFMPTGGINADNLNDYLDFPKVIACGGSWMVNKELISAGKFDRICELTREAVRKMLGFELKHVGINSENEKTADNTASAFENFFGFAKKSDSSSVFAGTCIEVMKQPYRGKSGHIAIGTNYIDRAVYHMVKQGVKFDMSTAGYSDNGRLTSVYLKDEIGGFAVHLVSKT